MVRWRGGATAAALLLLIGTLNIGIGGQTSSLVPPTDESDWWSMIRLQYQTEVGEVQHREIADTNFQIVGVDLHDFTFATIYQKFGETRSVQRGDASTWREQACYKSSSGEHPTYLIFEHGEVNSSFYLFSETVPWNGSTVCTRSEGISEHVRTASGLHLGQTPGQVIRILGQPSKRRQDELVYLLETRKKTAPEALARARRQHPELGEEQFRKDYATYDLTVFIRVKFARAKMIYLGISTAETS